MNKNQPAHAKAIASLSLGTIGVVLLFPVYTSVISIILGFIGLVFAISSKKAGNTEGTRTAGFILCLITLIGSVILIVCLGIGAYKFSFLYDY